MFYHLEVKKKKQFGLERRVAIPAVFYHLEMEKTVWSGTLQEDWAQKSRGWQHSTAVEIMMLDKGATEVYWFTKCIGLKSVLV